MICRLMQSDARAALQPERLRPSDSEVRRLWCDNGKIAQLTGYRPRVDFEDGLARTIQWFGEAGHLGQYKTSLYNV